MDFQTLDCSYYESDYENTMKIEKNTLTRYFLQQASETEKLAIKKWLDESQEHEKEFVRERIHFDASLIADENKTIINRPNRKSINLRPFLNIAASIVFAIISIYFYDSYKISQLSSQLQTITTPLSCRTHITLPDGSQVWLNSNTTLVYSTVFSETQRKVTLNGEAYFDIAKSEKPFIVHTDKYDVEVLGTSFNINAYEGDFITSLFTGKVKLLSSSENIDDIYLTPGQTAELVDGKMVINNLVDMNSMRWKDGVLVLNDKTFEEVTEMLGKYFDMTIIIKNESVKSLGYSGSIRVIDGIEHSLKVLKRGQSFDYEIDFQTREIIIY